MHLVECDLITSLAGHGSHQETARRLFNACAAGKIQLTASVQAFQEMDLLIKQGKIKIEVPAETFFSELLDSFAQFGVHELPLAGADTSNSIRFRKKYRLTFNDSYYVAQAYRTGYTLLSHDQRYSSIKEIKTEHPRDALKRLEEGKTAW